MKRLPDKMLIILLGAIGDVVRALPLAVRIKKFAPDTELCWAVEPKSLGVIDRHPAVDRVILFDRGQGVRAYIDFLKRIRGERFPLVLDLQRHLKSGFSSFCTGAKTRIGFSRKNAKELNWIFNNKHIAEVDNFSSKLGHYQMFGDLLGLPPLEVVDFGFKFDRTGLERWRNSFGEELKASATRNHQVVLSDRLPLGYVGMILGSSWPSRFWFAERYSQLALELWQEFKLGSVLVGGKGEEHFSGQITELVEIAGSAPVVSYCSRTSLRELPEMMASFEFVVGPDSGPMHIAAAVGVPVISLWGATSPKRSAPWGNERHVIEGRVACSPCYKRQCPLATDRLCMRSISVEEVMKHVRLIRGGTHV